MQALRHASYLVAAPQAAVVHVDRADTQRAAWVGLLVCRARLTRPTVGARRGLTACLAAVGGHLLVLTAFFVTAMVFQDAEKNGHLWAKRTLPPPRDKNKCVWDLEREG